MKLNSSNSKISNSKRNFIYNSLYQLLLIFIPLITTPYISRVLGAEKIGLFSYSHAIAYYFVIFIMLGLNNYGNRTIAFVRDDREKLSITFCEIYKMQLFISIIAIPLYIWYTIVFSNTIISWIMLIYVISGALDISWLFFGLEQFKLTAIRSSIIKLISTALIFIFVKDKDDIILYTTIYVLSFFANQIVLWANTKKHIDYKKVRFSSIFKHIKPNLILFIPIIATSIYRMMDKIMLGSLSSLEQVGYYESAEKIISVPTALVISLGTIMMPKISNLTIKKDDASIRKYIEKSIILAVLMASSMCFGIMAVSKEFVPIYFGEQYIPCIVLFQTLMPSCIFLAIADVIRTQYIIPHKLDRLYIASVLPGAIVNLTTNSILIPQYGASGAAFGTLLAEFIVCTLQALFVIKALNIIPYLLKASPYIIVGIIMYLVLWFLPEFSDSNFINLFLKILIGSLLYISFAFPIIWKQKIRGKLL